MNISNTDDGSFRVDLHNFLLGFPLKIRIKFYVCTICSINISFQMGRRNSLNIASFTNLINLVNQLDWLTTILYQTKGESNITYILLKDIWKFSALFLMTIEVGEMNQPGTIIFVGNSLGKSLRPFNVYFFHWVVTENHEDIQLCLLTYLCLYDKVQFPAFNISLVKTWVLHINILLRV